MSAGYCFDIVRRKCVLNTGGCVRIKEYLIASKCFLCMVTIFCCSTPGFPELTYTFKASLVTCLLNPNTFIFYFIHSTLKGWQRTVLIKHDIQLCLGAEGDDTKLSGPGTKLKVISQTFHKVLLPLKFFSLDTSRFIHQNTNINLANWKRFILVTFFISLNDKKLGNLCSSWFPQNCITFLDIFEKLYLHTEKAVHIHRLFEQRNLKEELSTLDRYSDYLSCSFMFSWDGKCVCNSLNYPSDIHRAPFLKICAHSMIWDEAEVGGLQYWVKWYVSQQNFCLHFHQIPVNVRKDTKHSFSFSTPSHRPRQYTKVIKTNIPHIPHC